MKTMSMLFAAAGATLAAAPALAQGATDFDRYGPHMMWWSGYGLVFGPLFMIAVLVLVVAFVVLLVRWLGGAPHAPHAHAPAGRALDILKERFARGEIDKAEYEERRRVLGE